VVFEGLKPHFDNHILLGVGLYFVRITHLRFDEKHATPDLTNPWQGSTKTPASVLTVHAAYCPIQLAGGGPRHLYLETSSVSKQWRPVYIPPADPKLEVKV
jgi:hypothetical protein